MPFWNTKGPELTKKAKMRPKGVVLSTMGSNNRAKWFILAQKMQKKTFTSASTVFVLIVSWFGAQRHLEVGP